MKLQSSFSESSAVWTEEKRRKKKIRKRDGKKKRERNERRERKWGKQQSRKFFRRIEGKHNCEASLLEAKLFSPML